MKHEKSFILCCNQYYLPIAELTIKSIRNFSDTPIIIYLINTYKEFQYKNVTSIRWDCNIRNESEISYISKSDNDNFYIRRDHISTYDILKQRPLITKHALENLSNIICYVDTDSVVFSNINKIFDLYPKEKNYPYFTKGIYNWMIYNGRGGSNDPNDLSTTLEHPVCELLGINQYNRLLTTYKQSGYYVAGQNTIPFLTEWSNICLNETISNNPSYYAPYHEETIVNCLLWKNEMYEGLPLVYVNGTIETIPQIRNEFHFNGKIQEIKPWLSLPKSRDDLFFIHGEKRIEIIDKMIQEMKKDENKIKVLFLAPHLSTGGMPGFLLKRIECLTTYFPNVEIFIVEYSNHSPIYVVQKNRIKEIISPDHFWTLGSDKIELINIIKENKIDIVHVDEILEGFDFYNQVSPQLMNQLYSSDRTWKIIETNHNITFNPSISKKFHPEAYAFCSPYHKKITFYDMPSYGEVIEFPIEKRFRTKEEQLLSQEKLGMDLNKKHVINVGLWTSGKNQKEVIEIARIVEYTNPEIEFHFIGNQAPNFMSYWQPLMVDLPSNVKVWGERNDVSDFMKAADVFLFTSTFECNPLVLREAASYGLNILSRNLPQYVGMFDDYIIEIDNNIELTKNKLLNAINTEIIYDTQEGQLKDFAQKHFDLYQKVKTFEIKQQELFKTNVKIIHHYVENPFLEIIGESDSYFEVKFFDENGVCKYQNIIKSNHWVKLNRQYYTKWNVKVWENGNLIYDDTLSLKNKRVLICFESSSLGDTLAWIPYVEEFQEKHKCKVVVSTFKNDILKRAYPNLEFISPGTTVNNLYALYRIGWFYDINKEPEIPNTIPLQKTITNILGLEHKEIKPKVYYKKDIKPYYEKYVTIATNSTAGCKFWTKEGWQELIDYLIMSGYRVINVSKEKNEFNGVTQITDNTIEHTMNVIHHSEFFIGLSSGLSWLAWAMNKHVVMISNFTTPDHEFTSDCTRIINQDVCNGCWNNPNFKFEKSDWDWCPIWKNTERHFECHKMITSKMVINQMQHLLNAS